MLCVLGHKVLERVNDFDLLKMSVFIIQQKSKVVTQVQITNKVHAQHFVCPDFL